MPDGDYRHFEWNSGEWAGRVDKPDALKEVLVGGNRVGWMFTAADDAIYRYDADGVWVSLERGGQLTALAYSDAATPANIAPRPGFLISVTDPRGRGLAFRYDADGYLVTVIDPSGSQYHYRYDSEQILDLAPRNVGNVRFVDRPGGATREYRYDEVGHVAASAPNNGLLTGIIDENGGRYGTYEYDDDRRAFREWHGSHGADLISLTYQADYDVANSSTKIHEVLDQTIRRNFATVAGIVRDTGVDRCDDAACTTISASSSKSYEANGNRDLDTDFNGNVTDHDFNTRGLETRRIEASTDATAKRTTETAWNTAFNVPDHRTIKNASDTPESLIRWTYNTRGQSTARCEVEPTNSGATSYTCGSATNAPTGVRQTRTTYCEASDVTAGICPLVGLVTSVNGARSTSDAGMSSGDDITTYTYYQTDDATCASNGACPHRKGDLWKVTNALGQVTETVSYDKNGRVTRTKDANGTYTDFAYHARGWLTDRSVRASATGTPGVGDATLHIDYDAVGNVTKVTQPDGAFLAYTYDDAHRLLKITDNLANSIDYCPGGVGSADCLDAAGNRRIERTSVNPDVDLSPIKRQLSRVYNQLGQLTQVKNAAGTAVETSAGIGGTGIADGYDGNGNRVLKDDGLGIRTEQDYDPLNRLKATIQNLGGTDTATQNATTGYTYDTRDNLRQVTDPDGLNTNYTYDGLNNLTALDSPDTGHTGYTYDGAGNRTSQTDARNVTSTYTYDRLNRLVGIGYPTTSLNITYAYDQADATTGCSGSFPKGRLTRMTDASGSTTYCYDRRGNVLKKTQVAAGATKVVQYTYTTADRIETISYPSGGIVTYVRDAMGRIASMSWRASPGVRGSTLVSSATYLPFGPLTTLTFGNGRTQTKAYDQDYAIDRISGTPAGALTLDFMVDVMGDITSASGTINPTTPDRLYQYDALYRLTGATTGSSSPLEAYTYNKTGDRQTAALNGGTPTVNAYAGPGHRLTGVGGVARTYDNSGNTLTGTLGVPGFTFTYDDRNRLATATKGTTVVTNQYNGRGERVSKTTAVSGTGPTAVYVYDEGGRLLADDTTEYIYLDSVPVGVVRGGVLYYVEADHLGTPRQVVKPAGNVVVGSGTPCRTRSETACLTKTRMQMR